MSYSEAELDDLAARFVSREIPLAEWTHLAHLAIGAWHVDRYGPDDALARMRTGIRRLNDSHGTPNTSTSGYHETITRAYVQLLRAFLRECPSEEPLHGRVDRLTTSRLAERNFLLSFYSSQRLMSEGARTAWIEPDLVPLALAGGVVDD
ncbi:MAG: hypothetical protein ABI877_16025 [Gemmatimonadaceae bacterium]